MAKKESLQEAIRRSRQEAQTQRNRKGKARRRRPASRARASQARRKQKPMPKPPARRSVKRAAPLTAPPARATSTVAGAETAVRVEQLQNEFANLEAKAQLGTVYDTIGNFDERLLEFPLRLEKLRDRGYVHSGYLEDALEAMDDRWDEIRPRVDSALRTQVQRLERELDEAERNIERLRPTPSSIRVGETTLNGLLKRIDAATQAVEGLYDGLDSELDQLGWALHRFEQMMDLIDESTNIKLNPEEGPLAAVKAVWHRDGDEGPEGVLILTDQHLFFEQREEVVTKRRFGIFKADSEMIQELHIKARISEIDRVEASEEGGFLGMGKDDILELVFAATAPVSRARFHLKGQESEAWRTLIKKAQSGEIDADRADEYEDDLAELEATAASFPTECPNCIAPVEPPARGIATITCEFCGAVIKPEADAE